MTKVDGVGVGEGLGSAVGGEPVWVGTGWTEWFVVGRDKALEVRSLDFRTEDSEHGGGYHDAVDRRSLQSRV